MKNEEKNLFRMIPKVDELLKEDKLREILDSYKKELVSKEIDTLLNKIREEIKNGMNEAELIKRISDIPDTLIKSFLLRENDNLRRVINATGTVIHTNLGRSLLSEKIAKKIADSLSHYSNLEFDVEEGKRGSRYVHVENLLCELTGAEGAMVVNNNAAAVLLVLSTFAKGKEVVISRGELIEIGGSFRIPDVMEYSGCKLREVGTTNKTHLRDYEEAISEETGALMKVHTSNYRIYGFTEDVSANELRELANKNNLPLIEDLGSGVLLDLSEYGMSHEPTVMDSIKNGIDVVTFSGDKLLGGPQAGIIVGKREFIEKLKKNQLTRALRVDKMTFKALEETLKVYFKKSEIISEIPTINMLTLSMSELSSRALRIRDILSKFSYLDVTLEDSYSEVGGGSLPTEKLKTKIVKIKHKNLSEQNIDKNLREFRIPIVGRMKDSYFILDPRTILRDDYELIEEAFRGLGE